MPEPEPWPTELRVGDHGRSLIVSFEGGGRATIAAELLRVESPSAEVQGHSPDEKQLVWGKRDVTIRKVEPVGNYAVRLHFSDGHDSGIFTWRYLARLGLDHAALMAGYEERLAAAGKRR